MFSHKENRTAFKQLFSKLRLLNTTEKCVFNSLSPVIKNKQTMSQKINREWKNSDNNDHFLLIVTIRDNVSANNFVYKIKSHQITVSSELIPNKFFTFNFNISQTKILHKLSGEWDISSFVRKLVKVNVPKKQISLDYSFFDILGATFFDFISKINLKVDQLSSSLNITQK